MKKHWVKTLSAGAISISLCLLACSPGGNNPNPVGNPTNPGSNGVVSVAKPQATQTGRGGGGNTGGKDESGSLGAEKPANQATGNKTLFAVYLLGSDLEDDVQDPKGTADEVTTGGPVSAGAGSDDLREMTAAFKAMSEEQRARLDVVVGFGGARKAGWKGIKYADANCIVKDSEDNYFGNDSCYLSQDANADMGKGETSAAFVKFLGEKYPAADYSRRMFVFWDHGGAHRGYGPDTNTDTAMTLKELNDTFASEQSKYDLIGFDTCLMGSLDVVPFVRNNARFMLASEELEPGHGWQYTDVLSQLANAPDASTEEIGKFMVNSFVTTQAHRETDGKTLSLLDMSQFDNVISALNETAGALKGKLAEQAAYEAVIQSAKTAESYGKSAQSPGFSMDIKHFLSILKSKDASVDVSRLEQALDRMIVASQQDGTRPKATGLAIFQLSNREDYSEKAYKAERAASADWFSFVDALVGKGQGDQQAPTIQPAEGEGDFETQAEAGATFKISDDVGLLSVETVRLSSTDEKNFTVLGVDNAESGANGIYRSRPWDGEVLLLCQNGACSGKDLIVPAELADYDDNEGTTLYVADGRRNGQDSVFYFERDAEGNVVDYWVTPYTTDDKGNVTQISREQFSLEKGDTVAFYYQHINIDSDEEDYELGESVTFSSEPGFAEGKVDEKLYTFLLAEDLKGNIQNSDLYAIN